MNTLELAKVIKKAILGDEKSFLEIVKIYEPLINKYSLDYLDNKIDEDCKSIIIEKLYKEIRKFK
jgi:hypothetical protein